MRRFLLYTVGIYVVGAVGVGIVYAVRGGSLRFLDAVEIGFSWPVYVLQFII
jgi:hypothetical protein